MKNLFSVLAIVLCVYSFSQKGFISEVCFNTPGDDFGIRFIDDKTYFITESIDISGDFRPDNTSVHNFTDIYEVQGCKAIEARIKSKDFGKETSVNSNWYDGPLSYSEKDSIIFFSNTSEGYNHGEMGIYLSQKDENGEYSSPISFKYNSNIYSCLHPFYDNESDYLYFSSDMDSSSNFDIYRILFQNNIFGELEKLDSINSKNDELFPMIHNKTLYFTSERSMGMGGMDIYQSKDFKLSSLLPEPINSTFDDLAIIFITENKGYFSSNRKQENFLGDEIYEFYIPKINKVDVNVSTKTEDLLSDLNFFLKDFQDIDSLKALLVRIAIDQLEYQEEQINQLHQKINDKIDLISGFIDTSSLIVFDDKINFYEKILSYRNNLDFTENDTILLKQIAQNGGKPEFSAFVRDVLTLLSEQIIEKEYTAFLNGTLIPFLQGNELLNLKLIIDYLNIQPEDVNNFWNDDFSITFYFDFDESVIKEDHRERLKFIVNVINNSDGKIMVEGHTDSKGRSFYNDKLALNRAQEVSRYMVDVGISPDKIKILSSGEKKPVAPNLTKVGRALNRRVIVSF